MIASLVALVYDAVDAMLAPIGLTAVIACDGSLWAVVLASTPIGVLALMAWVLGTRGLVVLEVLGKMTLASSGNGSTQHLTGALFANMAGIKITHIPYRGSGPVTADLLGGQVQLAFPGIAGMLPHIKTGKLQALGLASKSRSDELPNLPTLAEQLKSAEYDVTSIFSFMAPANTPRAVIAKVQASVNQALAQADTAKRFTTLGATVPPALSPDETLAMFKAEAARWSKVVKAANIKKS